MDYIEIETGEEVGRKVIFSKEEMTLIEIFAESDDSLGSILEQFLMSMPQPFVDESQAKRIGTLVDIFNPDQQDSFMESINPDE